MIGGIKDMIAGCIERMRARSCGTCERRDNCAFVWPEAIGAAMSARRTPSRSGRRRGAFALLLNEIAKAVGKEMRTGRSSLRREVERHLEPLLASGAARIDRVAKAMGCSRQTLYRRLKAEGLTFEQILDGLRHRRALGLVRDQGLSVKEAAYRLGFSDPAAFSRAFKRWTGQSPRNLRGLRASPHPG
jgi:AraC-like DNA-binding protein